MWSGHRHLHGVGGVRAEHHQFAMRHVDDAHDAKRNGQSDGDQHQHRAQAQAKEQRLDAGIEGAPTDRCVATAAAAAPPHFLVAFGEAAVGDFIEQQRQPVPHILADAVAQRRDRVETRLAVRAIESGQRQAGGDFLLHAGIGFHAASLAQNRDGRVVQRPQHVPHRVQPDRQHPGSTARSAPRSSSACAANRCSCRFWSGYRRARIRQSFSDSGSIRLKRIAFGRLDDEDLLIVCCGNKAGLPEAPSGPRGRWDGRPGSAVRRSLPCRSSRLAQLAERRQETCVVGRLGA